MSKSKKESVSRLNKKPDVSFGGQAVMEGVMMRSPNYYSVATIKNKKIKVKLEKADMFSKKPILNWFFIRGIVGLVEMLYLGLKTLIYSANQVEESDEKLSNWEIIYSLILSFAFGILIFVVAPLALTKLFVKSNGILFNTVDGLIRVLFFFIYIYLISLSKDIKRIFQFHGAEHTTINAYEAGVKLTPKNVKKFGTFHPRCGTSFIFIVLIISIVVFSLIKSESFWIKLAGRLILLPIVAAISYEILKFSAKLKGPFAYVITLPGRLVQKITSQPPDELQIKVAIAALNAVVNAEKKINTK